MKLTRKLIPAFAMLLVSAVLMSTASFAWFSMNGDVTATGIEVTATAPAALWISATGSSYDKTMEFATVATNKDRISPVTNSLRTSTNLTGNASSWKFDILKDDATYAKVNTDGKIVEDGEVVEDLSSYVKEDTEYNVYKNSFFLKLEGVREKVEGTDVTPKKNVSVSATVASSGSDGIIGSLRIALVTAGSGTSDGMVASGAGSAIFEISGAGTTASKPLSLVAANDAVEVYVYIWFEGTDTDCKNTNAQNLNDISVSFAFTAA